MVVIFGVVRTNFRPCGVAAGYGEHEGNLEQGPLRLVSLQIPVFPRPSGMHPLLRVVSTVFLLSYQIVLPKGLARDFSTSENC